MQMTVTPWYPKVLMWNTAMLLISSNMIRRDDDHVTDAVFENTYFVFFLD